MACAQVDMKLRMCYDKQEYPMEIQAPKRRLAPPMQMVGGFFPEADPLPVRGNRGRRLWHQFPARSVSGRASNDGPAHPHGGSDRWDTGTVEL